MYDRILKQMRERIRTRQYVMTLHAEEEMADDNLSILTSNALFLQVKLLNDKKTKIQKSGNTLLKVEPFQPAWRL